MLILNEFYIFKDNNLIILVWFYQVMTRFVSASYEIYKGLSVYETGETPKFQMPGGWSEKDARNAFEDSLHLEVMNDVGGAIEYAMGDRVKVKKINISGDDDQGQESNPGERLPDRCDDSSSRDTLASLFR